MDELFEEYLLSNEYDRFEGYLLSIVRDAYRAGFLAGLNAKPIAPHDASEHGASGEDNASA